MTPLKSEKGVSLLEVIMLIIIISFGTFSVGGIVANILNISTKTLIMRKATSYAEVLTNRVQAYAEECNLLHLPVFLKEIQSNYNNFQTSDKYKYTVTVDSIQNFIDNSILSGRYFDKIYVFRVQVDHNLLKNPVELNIYFPLYQNDYKKY